MAIYWQSKAIRLQKYNLCVQIKRNDYTSEYALKIYQKYNCNKILELSAL